MFFSATPNFLYPDFKTPGKYKLSKNLFRKIRARDSFNAIYASSKQYTITLGETPDSIAYSKYGDSKWYWTILVLNNILDINTQWPLSGDELERLIDSKYGDLADKPRHWETSKILDSNDNIVLDGGIIVELFQNRDDQNQTNYYPKVRDENGGSVLSFDIVSEGTGYSTGTNIQTISVGTGLIIDIKTVDIYGKIKTADVSLGNGAGGRGYSVGDIITVSGGNKNAVLKVKTATSLEKTWDYTYINNIDGDSVDYKTVTAQQNLVMVTNREYELELNELKREIYIPSRSALPVMEEELNTLLRYDTEYKITKEGYRESERV